MTNRLYAIIPLLTFLTFSAAAEYPAQHTEDTGSRFDGIVDFSVSLRELDRRVRDDPDSLLHESRLFVLEGLVSGISITDRDPERFRAVIELVNGEWIGLDRIATYRALLRFAGSAFIGRFADGSRRSSVDGIIGVNSRLLVVARMADIVVDAGDEARMPVLDVLHARIVR